MTSIWNI